MYASHTCGHRLLRHLLILYISGYSERLLGDTISVSQMITVTASNGTTFTVKSRLDTDPEVAYFMNGGILRYVLRKLL